MTEPMIDVRAFAAQAGLCLSDDEVGPVRTMKPVKRCTGAARAR